MKQAYIIAFITGVCLLLVSCQSDDTVASYINIEATEDFLNKEKEVQTYPDIGDEDIFDFAFINGAPRAEEAHDVDEIIKVYATSWTIDEISYPIVLDIENSELYIEADIGRFGVSSETDRKKVDDINKVLDLFEKYDVLDWQHYYSDVKSHHSYEDGASWSLTVQYEDGTIEVFRGEGIEEITPDTYDEFMNALKDYVNGHIND